MSARRVVPLHHVEAGTGPALFLGSSLGSTHELWGDLVTALAGRFRVVAFDTRGHGGSPPATAPLGVADLAADVVALADRLGVDRFHYLGISLGGAIGQQLALDHGRRLTGLTLACTSPRFGDAATWVDRAAAVRADGVAPLREGTGQRWFGDDVRDEPRAQHLLDLLADTDPESYAACCEALAEFDVTGRLDRIDVPTRVIGGELDPTCPPEVAARLAEGIPGAEGPVLIPGAFHLANVCRPEAFRDAVLDQLG